MLGTLTVGLTAVTATGGGPLHALRALALNCVAPQLTGVGNTADPQSGHAATGSTVVLTGSNLDEGSRLLCSSTLTVYIGGRQFSIDSNSGSATQQRFTLTAPAYGTVSVVDGDGHPSNNNLVLVTDPTVGSLPGSVGANQVLSASGSGLDLGGRGLTPTVSWSTIAGSCPRTSSASIASGGGSVTTPALGQFCRASANLSLPFTADTNGRQGSIQLPLGTVVVAASFASLTPTTATAGSPVTVTGSGFGTSGTATVGGVTAVVLQWTDTTISVKLPDGAQGGTVALTRSDGAAINAGTVTETARIDAVSPSPALPGTTVTVSGGAFGPSAGSISVAGVPATVGTWSPTSVTFTMPAGTQGSELRLTRADGSAVTSTLGAASVLTGVSPDHGAAGAVVQLSGSGLGSAPGNAMVGSTPANIQLWADTQVVVTIPSGLAAGPTSISLTPLGRGALSTRFTVDPGAATPPGPQTGGSPGATPAPGASATPDSTPGPRVPSFIAPSAGGPIVSTSPVQFQPPPKTAGPVALSLTPKSDSGDPGNDVPVTVALVAFGKPVAGAKVQLQLVVEPGRDAAITPADGVTDADGTLTGTLHLSATAGDHILLATSGQYSDEVRVVGRGADTGAVAGLNQAGGTRTDAVATVFGGAPRTLIIGGLVLCLVLFLAGFAIQILVPRHRAPARVTGSMMAPATGRPRRARRSPLDAGNAVATLLQFAVVALALVVTLPVTRLARLLRPHR